MRQHPDTERQAVDHMLKTIDCRRRELRRLAVRVYELQQLITMSPEAVICECDAIAQHELIRHGAVPARCGIPRRRKVDMRLGNGRDMGW